MDDQRLALLRELERADEAVAARLEVLDGLYAAVEELRERALELKGFFARLPGERQALADAVEEADRAFEDARVAAEQAAREQARAEEAGDPERLAEARRFEVRVRDSLHMAERRAAAARGQASELAAHAAAAERETAGLEARAAELAVSLAARPGLTDDAVAEPGAGAAGVAEWGTRARAALLVARSQVSAEGDAVVRQANELGSAVLGEPLPPLGAREVARRVEGTLGG
jgi:hypothetical protein